jgi:hypothetical protein
MHRQGNRKKSREREKTTLLLFSSFSSSSSSSTGRQGLRLERKHMMDVYSWRGLLPPAFVFVPHCGHRHYRYGHCRQRRQVQSFFFSSCPFFCLSLMSGFPLLLRHGHHCHLLRFGSPPFCVSLVVRDWVNETGSMLISKGGSGFAVIESAVASSLAEEAVGGVYRLRRSSLFRLPLSLLLVPWTMVQSRLNRACAAAVS